MMKRHAEEARYIKAADSLIAHLEKNGIRASLVGSVARAKKAPLGRCPKDIDISVSIKSNRMRLQFLEACLPFKSDFGQWIPLFNINAGSPLLQGLEGIIEIDKEGDVWVFNFHPEIDGISVDVFSEDPANL